MDYGYKPELLKECLAHISGIMSKLCFINCSWKDKGGGDIDRVTLFRMEQDNSTPLPTKGLSLQPHGTDSGPCTFTIASTPDCGLKICAVDVLCNARRMELYCDKGEYMCTEEGMLIKEIEDDDTKLYMLQKTLEPEVSLVTIKLVSLQWKNELFLHSLHITVKPSEIASPIARMMSPSIDLDRVKSMMSDSGKPMSDGAKGLMNIMESFQKNQSNVSQQMGSLTMMMSMFSSMGCAAGGSMSRNLAAESHNNMEATALHVNPEVTSTLMEKTPNAFSLPVQKHLSKSPQPLDKMSELTLGTKSKTSTDTTSNIHTSSVLQEKTMINATVDVDSQCITTTASALNAGIETPHTCNDVDKVLLKYSENNTICRNCVALMEKLKECSGCSILKGVQIASVSQENNMSVVPVNNQKSVKDEDYGVHKKKLEITNTESIQNMKEFTNSISNESLASYSSNDGTELLGMSENPTVVIDSSKILTMQDLKHFEKKILNSISESEKRVKSSLEESLGDVEKKMCEKFDELMDSILSLKENKVVDISDEISTSMKGKTQRKESNC